MKIQKLLCTTLCLMIGLSSVPTFGQRMPGIKVNVPFTFSLNDKTYPAGDYTFTALRQNIVVLQPTDHSKPAMIMANPTAARSKQDKSNVRFECYDRDCFLSQIWIPGHDGGYELRRSSTEIRVAANKTGKYVALLGKGPQR
jgi:hypothetical protein